MKQDETLVYDVLIVGAGPAGVVSANLLGKQGVRVLLIDKEADVLEIPRAVGLCNEGSRILNAAGLMGKINDNILPMEQVQFRGDDMRPFFSVDCSEKVNGYNIIRTIYQPDLERAIREALEDHDSVDFLRSTECLQIEDRGDMVHCRLVTQETCVDSQELQHHYHNIRCRYVMGCDGARSSIRKMMGVTFSGHTYAQDWLILDVKNDPEEHTHNINHQGKTNERDVIYFMCDPKRPGVTLPTPNGSRRWEFVVKKNESLESITSDSRVKELLAPWGDAEKMDVVRKAIYTFHARIAQRFRVGNVFLVGDAAHLTPPFAGQGLMAGFRDAYNISWKLAAVLQGRLPDEFLNTYHSERHPQAVIIVNLARFLGMIILPQRRWMSTLRNVLFRTYNKIAKSDSSYSLKKTPNSTLGFRSLKYGLGDISDLLVGFEFLQGMVTDRFPNPEAEVQLIDNFLPERYLILSYEAGVEDYLSEDTKHRFSNMAGQFCVINSIGTNPEKGQDSKVSGIQLYDIENYYRPLFNGGEKVVVIRPDKMIAVCCDRKSLDQALRKYMSSIGVMAIPTVEFA